MNRALVCALALALVAAPAAGAKLPGRGVLVAGRSLAGVALGEPAAAVRARLGGSFGVCDGCAEKTWYYNYKPFTQSGLAVQLRRGRVDAVYTLWQPRGWRSDRGVRLGQPASAAFTAYRGLVSQACGGYSALTLHRGGTLTVFYVVDGKLWGFALQRPGVAVCR